MTFDISQDCARALDRADELAPFRERFYLPPGKQRTSAIYLCGNSLGLQPKRTGELLAEELQDWATHGVHGHMGSRRPWLPYHEQLTADTAAIVGALPVEVVNMNSLSVNLHLLMVSFYRPTRERPCILIESGAFPSDRYAVVSQLRFHGYSEQELIEIAPRDGEDCIRAEDLDTLLQRDGHRIALALLPGVQYRSGQAFDIAHLTRQGHKQGCVVGFDLAHAAGNLYLQLHDAGPDFAAWCSYKYLNGGPGAIAGCFVHERHANNPQLPRFAGWWGHDKTRRFLMEPDFKPLPGAEGWQLSNPPILSMTPLLASFELFRAAGMARLRAKAVQLTAYLEFLLDAQLQGRVSSVTPRAANERGCQLSLRIHGGVTRAKAVFTALNERDVICDWREPDIIRIAPVPLYNSFEDVWDFVHLLQTTTAKN